MKVGGNGASAAHVRRPLPPDGVELRATEPRLEFWDGDTETAVEVREATSPCHEGPSHRLAQLVERIALVRGRPIACFGTMDLEFPATFVRRLLASRGVAVSGNFPLDQPGFADADVEALADIALGCGSQQDFAARLARARDDAKTG